MMYLCTSLHYQELVEANDPMTARSLMIQAHPNDGEYCCYAATDDDLRIFRTMSFQPLTPRKKIKLNQLDWVSMQVSK